MPTAVRFLVTGSIAYDFLLGYEGSFAEAIDPTRLQELSISFFAPHLTRSYGGTAANIAWNLRLLGQDVALVGSVGGEGREYRDRLARAGVDITQVRVDDQAVTALAIVCTDQGERQIAFFHPGAARTPAAFFPPEAPSLYGIVTPEAPEAMVATAFTYQRRGVPYLFDPGQQAIVLSGDDLRRSVRGAAALVLNDYEWGVVSQKTQWSATEALDHVDLLAITHGEHGATLQTQEGTVVVPACTPDRVVNPTGAGDAFRAGLVTGLAVGTPLAQAGRLGCALASFVVEVEEAQLASLPRRAIAQRYQRHYGEALPLPW